VADVQQLFAGTRLTATVVGTTLGQASAAKQAYSLANKGRMVLAAMAAQLAEVHGVRGTLEAESHRPGAGILAELDELVSGLAEVGWRWGPEMEELAEALAGVGSEPSVARGFAAELRRRMHGDVRHGTAGDAGTGLGSSPGRG
jgi:hypothetical protein